MMSQGNSESRNGAKTAHSIIALVWAAVMITLTFALDNVTPLVPLWLLFGAWLIVKSR